ncbi:glyoxalase [Actinosynnema sp. ALI-1.44]|uniref:VOC family protein n=1 Tax=Actinosynnema sp. ALI-1.44 TaxID=1933779 RepID=UPI00097BA9C7|nr:VOC family protein [Actinosynnema sp. ALI-1.44]ONI87859.1 glyoxalase [Actinosynnema sp. ALI-1.44]
MLTLGAVILGVDDMARAVEFWSRALGYQPRQGESRDDWTVLDPPESSRGIQLALDRSDSAVQEIPRIHLDLHTENAQEQAAEVDRLISLGATRVEWPLYPPDPDFIVLADTEGNRFCVIDLAHG